MIPEQYQKNVYRAGLTLLVILSFYFGVKFLSEFRSYGMMGSTGANVITLTGHGEVQASPDIATIYFTIRRDAKTVKEAQDAVAAIEKKALDFLKQSGVDEKDFQASNASFYPKYQYNSRSVCYEWGCQPGNPTIVGYEVSESITVKVRKVDNVGMLMQGLGTQGVSDLSGPNFTVDNDDDLKTQARKIAIEDARKKAEALAKDLGVRLGRVANFSETGYPGPIYYGKDLAVSNGMGGPETAQMSLPQGQNTITSDVTVTYEIR